MRQPGDVIPVYLYRAWPTYASRGCPCGLVYSNAEGLCMTWRLTFALEDGTEDWTYATAGDAYDAMRAVNWVLGRQCALRAELAW